MRFYSRAYKDKLTDKAKFPCLVLVSNSWDDYGYKTTFSLYYYTSESYRELIGDVKILDLKTKETSLNESFLKLKPYQASLGQSLDYYTNIKNILPDVYEDVLNALNDIAINPGLRDEFENERGFETSLLRFSEAEKVLIEAGLILYDNDIDIDNVFNFSYSVKLETAEKPHTVKFNFQSNRPSAFRSVVLIGKNGTGKTQFLSNLASSLCEAGSQSIGKFVPARPLFSRIITISFSLFDQFKIPKSSKSFSYKYVGFRHADEILDEEAINNKLRAAFNLIKKLDRESVWFDMVSEVVDLESFGINVEEIFLLGEKEFEIIITNRRQLLGQGQNIFIYTISELIANLRKDSIVLFDEPETNLHPNAIAKLIKVLNEVLKLYRSYAVIATHSPIVVQETPSRNVRLFDRMGNVPIVKMLPEESFGENLSKITDFIFYRNEVKEVYKEYFDKRIKVESIEEINSDFDNNLSLNALLYLNAINKKKK